jgi:surface polysaccharide O-acyltransferase-like enzyme
MTLFILSKIVCVLAGGFVAGQGFRAFQEKNYSYAGFMLFIAIANLVILGRY